MACEVFKIRLKLRRLTSAKRKCAVAARQKMRGRNRGPGISKPHDGPNVSKNRDGAERNRGSDSSAAPDWESRRPPRIARTPIAPFSGRAIRGATPRASRSVQDAAFPMEHEMPRGRKEGRLRKFAFQGFAVGNPYPYPQLASREIWQTQDSALAFFKATSHMSRTRCMPDGRKSEKEEISPTRET